MSDFIKTQPGWNTRRPLVGKDHLQGEH
ncbi:MAG: hypothetical protein ACLS3S_09440 [Streptococcus salivarius]